MHRNFTLARVNQYLGELLSSARFEFVSDFAGDGYELVIFSNSEIQLAFTMIRGEGQNLRVAKSDVSIIPESIVLQKGGWQVIGKVQPSFWDRYNNLLSEWPGNPENNSLDQKMEIYFSTLKESLSKFIFSADMSDFFSKQSYDC